MQVRRLSCQRLGPPYCDDLSGQTNASITKSRYSYKNIGAIPQNHSHSTLAVHIFLVCTQVNNEAASIFYGNNMFAFCAVPDFYSFFIHVRHRLPQIRKLGLMTPDDWNASYSGAVNLEALYLHTKVLRTISSTSGANAAYRFYSLASAWSHSLTMKHKNPLAVLDVLKLPPTGPMTNLVGSMWYADAAKLTTFRTTLAGVLTSR